MIIEGIFNALVFDWMLIREADVRMAAGVGLIFALQKLQRLKNC